jgi:N-acetylneuraminic acid mutarotase
MAASALGADTLLYENFEDDTAQTFAFDTTTWDVQGPDSAQYLIQLDLNYAGYHTAVFGPASDSGRELSVRFKMLQKGQILFRAGYTDAAQPGYSVVFDFRDSTLALKNPADSTLQRITLHQRFNVWYAFKLYVYDRVLSVTVDDTLRLVHLTAGPTAGKFVLATRYNMRAVFDDVLIIRAPQIYHPPVFVTQPSDMESTALESTMYSDTVKAVDTDFGDDVTYRLFNPGALSLPGGMGFDTISGLITWIPTKTETKTVTLTIIHCAVVYGSVVSCDTGVWVGRWAIGIIARDRIGLEDTLIYFIQSSSKNHAPIFQAPPDSMTQGININEWYVDTAMAVDPDTEAVFYSIITAPDSMTLDTLTGRLRWLPRVADLGVHPVTIAVRDRQGLADTLAFSLNVFSIPRPPIFITTSDSMRRTIQTRQWYTDTVLAYDPNETDTVTYGLIRPYPDSLTLDPLTGILAWRPTRRDTGLHVVRIRAYDAGSLADTLVCSLTVVFVRPDWCECSANAPEVEWAKTFGGVGDDAFYDAQVTEDGGLLAVGTRFQSAITTPIPHTDNDVWLVRLNADGETLWTRQYGGQWYEEGGSLIKMNDAGFAVAGWSKSSVALSRLDAYLLRLKANGDTLWTKIIFTDTTEGSAAGAIASLSGSDLVWGGWHFDRVFNNAIVSALDSSGQEKWSRTYSQGGTGASVNALAVAGKNLALAGEVITSGHSLDVLFTVIDSIGNPLIQRVWVDNTGMEMAHALTVTSDHGYLLAGERSNDLWLIKTDSLGETLWTKTYGDGGAGLEVGRSVITLADGGYLVVGNRYMPGQVLNDLWVLRTDPWGDTLWTCALGFDSTDDVGYAVRQTSDGGWVVVGTTDSPESTGTQGWIVKLAPEEPPAFSSPIGLTLDSVARANTLLSNDIAVHYTFTDTSGRACRVGDIYYSVGNKDDWQPAGLNSVRSNPYHPEGSYSFLWNSQLYFNQRYVSSVYLKFCVADSAGDSTRILADTLPMMREQPGQAALDNQIYLIGGFKQGVGYTSQVDRYDPLRHTWKTRAALHLPRQALATAVVNGKIYAIGGWNDSAQAMSTVEEYDPELNRWTLKAPLPTPRFGLAAGVVHGKIYAVGGFNARNDYVATVEEYDPARNIWRARTPLPQARYQPAMAAANDRLYVVGGYSALDGGFFAQTLEFDALTNTWTVKASIPTVRHSHELVTVNGKLYALGGWNQTQGYLKSVEVYDPQLNAWQTDDALILSRAGYAGVALAGRVFLVGGMNASGYLSRIEEYVPSVYSNYVVSAPLDIDNYQRPVEFITTAADLQDTVLEDALYLDTVRAHTPDPDSHCTYTLLPNAPDSMTLDSTAGTIRWTPHQPDVGNHTIIIRAADNRGSADTLAYVITVLNVDDRPVIQSLTVSDDSLAEGDTTYLAAVVTDEENDTLHYEWIRNRRDTLSTLAAFNYVPGYVGGNRRDTLVFIVGDGHGPDVRDTVYLLITNTPLPPQVKNIENSEITNRTLLAWGWVTTPRDPDLDSASIRFTVALYNDAAQTRLVGLADTLGTYSILVNGLGEFDTLAPQYVWVRVKAHDRHGYSTGYSRPYRFFFANYLFLDRYIPKEFDLGRNYPNPFTEKTKIRFQVPPTVPATVTNFQTALNEQRTIDIQICNLDGAVVRALVNGPVHVGFHLIVFDGKDDQGHTLRPGAYVCRMKAPGFVKMRWMVKVR